MTIRIEALSFDAIMGVFESERKKTQPIRIDVVLTYTYREGNYLNYAQIAQNIENFVIYEKFYLIEEALLRTREMLLQTYGDIQKLSLKITKPEALQNAVVSVEN